MHALFQRSFRRVVFIFLALVAPALLAADTNGVWPVEKAKAWHDQTGWLVGCNFSPSTAMNQLEMWQAETFDPTTIDRELGYAEGLGFNTARVFLHNLVWQQDSAGFTARLELFLGLADKHHIKPILVFFDSCWDPNPKLGKQHEPKPFVHNSGWVQSPGQEYMAHPKRLDELKSYVIGVMTHFKDDKRIAMWDLYNEPDNHNDSSYGTQEPNGKSASSLTLLKKVFAWAREVGPSQPVSSAPWHGHYGAGDKLSLFEDVQLNESDVITFHNYDKVGDVKKCIDSLRHFNRPIVCTEYMARPIGSTFDPVLGVFKQEDVGAYNWGFVSGRTQTIFPWDSWSKHYTNEPPLWFHDILHADGTPYKTNEVAYIRKVTGVSKSN